MENNSQRKYLNVKILNNNKKSINFFYRLILRYLDPNNISTKEI